MDTIGILGFVSILAHHGSAILCDFICNGDCFFSCIVEIGFRLKNQLYEAVVLHHAAEYISIDLSADELFASVGGQMKMLQRMSVLCERCEPNR